MTNIVCESIFINSTIAIDINIVISLVFLIVYFYLLLLSLLCFDQILMLTLNKLCIISDQPSLERRARIDSPTQRPEAIPRPSGVPHHHPRDQPGRYLCHGTRADQVCFEFI